MESMLSLMHSRPRIWHWHNQRFPLFFLFLVFNYFIFYFLILIHFFLFCLLQSTVLLFGITWGHWVLPTWLNSVVLELWPNGNHRSLAELNNCLRSIMSHLINCANFEGQLIDKFDFYISLLSWSVQNKMQRRQFFPRVIENVLQLSVTWVYCH